LLFQECTSRDAGGQCACTMSLDALDLGGGGGGAGTAGHHVTGSEQAGGATGGGVGGLGAWSIE
jgi:hypothetical protein